MKKILATVFLCAATSACSGGAFQYVRAPERESAADVARAPETEAFEYLSSSSGPTRFARVAPGVYRGGQPSRIDLEHLYALGVRTVVDLRREEDDVWHREEREAKALGMKFVHTPFYGVFGQSDEFYQRIVDELKKGDVYVHCKHGRDRTSLVVALYRVVVQSWEAPLAWKLEAVDYGSAQTWFYRQLRVDFQRIAKHQAALLAKNAGAHSLPASM